MFRPMRHNTVVFRTWEAIEQSIVGAPIACSKCGLPGHIAGAVLEGHASGRFAHPMRLMVDAFFDCCGYQTFYFQKGIDRAIAIESRSFSEDSYPDPQIPNEFCN